VADNCNSPTVIDLFSGAGGVAASFERAGFRTTAVVELDCNCIATLRANQAAELPIDGRNEPYLLGTRILNADVRDVHRRDLVPEGVGADWRPDVLSGGPPCQPFSFAGLGRGMSDPRGQLFSEFVRIAAELRPRVILFENVPGLVTAKCAEGRPGGVLEIIQRSFEAIGYGCHFSLLNAADFGAPQRRTRLYMIATDGTCRPNFPIATHEQSAVNGLLPWVSLGSWLAALPRPSDDEIVRPSGKRAHDLQSLRPGEGLKAGGIVEANRPGGHWGYRQDCFRADERLPSRTIRAASTPDWISDDRGLRRLTWRECATLQFFPSEWAFAGSSAAKFRQIGNAVQGHIGIALARSILSSLAGNEKVDPVSTPWPQSFHKRVRYTVAEHRVNGAHRAAARQQHAA